MKTSTKPLRITMVSPEVVPFSKTGGLADVVAGLSAALSVAGHDVSVITPLYESVDRTELRLTETELGIPLGEDVVTARVWEAHSAEGVVTYFLDVPELYDRSGLYGERGVDYPDNARRFTALCRGAMELLSERQGTCDIVHVHDWQTALIPLYMKSVYADETPFGSARSVLTLHNLAYQGIHDLANLAEAGLGASYGTPRYLEFHGSMSFLKAGIVAADALTTVSPTYASEVLTEDFGCGLEGVLAARSSDLVGVLNGIDTSTWDPSTDAHLPVRYRLGAMQGKGKCKTALQRELGLPSGANTPLIGMVTRLVPQKGIDLLIASFRQLRETDANWVILGNGQPELERQLRGLARAHPGRLAVRIGFDDALAHRIQGGCDFTLMPSRFEPCGLSQLYALRYGTIPIVRAVGGLADTVIDVTENPQRGTGISFQAPTAVTLTTAIRRALGLYRKPKIWAALRRRAMEQDFSWGRSARTYARLYSRLKGRPAAAIPPGPGQPAPRIVLPLTRRKG